MSQVILQSNRKDDLINKGLELPYLVQTEPTSSVTLLVDSKDRISGTPSDFRASFRSRIPRTRYINLDKVSIPKIPNVNPNNYTLQIKHALGTTAQFNIPVGIYSTTSLCNQLTNSINAAFLTAAIVDTVTTVYDPTTRTFRISTISGQFFFIINTCSFITRGNWLVPFESEPISNFPSKNTIYSGIASMLYSRYLTVASQTLNTYSYGSSVTTRASQPTQIVGLINLCDIYNTEDFDVSVPYTSIYKNLDVEGCHINVANTQKSLFEEIDITIQDEYGSILDSSLSLGSPYPSNNLGLVLFFKCSF